MDIKNTPPLVAALHDMSSFGRCALSVITPVLSSLGTQVCAVPTALLSTHTGGFEDFCFEDTTDFLANALEHFKKLNLDFDAVYSGFLGSNRQIAVVHDYLSSFPNALHLIDPVMGDNGKVYKTYTKEMCLSMQSLAKKAHIITPNLTEAAILLNENYKENISQSEIKAWVNKLSLNGNCSVIITGIVREGMIHNYCFDKNNGKFFSVDSPIIGADYPGTGDIFASVMLGSLLKGNSLYDAVTKASEFVSLCINITYSANTPKRNGILLESVLHKL